MIESNKGSILIDRVIDWLMDQALRDADLETIVRGVCERLHSAGMPICRVSLSFSVLHPLYRAMGFTWRRGKGLEIEGYRHLDEAKDEDRFLKSPYYHLLKHELDHLRRRLDNDGPVEFPIFEDLRAEGVTDYLAFAVSFHEGRRFGMMGSWSTDQKGGFSEAELRSLLRVQGRFAVACKMAVREALTHNILATYLGRNAGGRVLDGQIKRGDGETTRAAIVFGDLRDSTQLADACGRQNYIDTLNDFFDATGGAIIDAGGEVLSFIGDGFIGIFPCDRNKKDSTIACRKALGAAHDMIGRVAELNDERVKDGHDPLRYGVALHIGNVMFGNVGMADRMTFSIFGSSVNEAARIEKLTRDLHTTVLASKSFRDYAGGAWNSQGKQVLAGIEQPVELFAPKGQARAVKTAAEWRRKMQDWSDAENVVLLHRDGR